MNENVRRDRRDVTIPRKATGVVETSMEINLSFILIKFISLLRFSL